MDRHITGTVDTTRGPVIVDLTIDGTSARLVADGREVGAWSLGDVDLETVDDGTLAFTVDSDTLVIRPDAATELRRIGSSSMWVTAAPGVWERAERTARRDSSDASGNQSAIVLGAALGVVSVVAAIGMTTTADATATPMTPEPTVVETTVAAPPTTAVEVPLGPSVDDVISSFNAVMPIEGITASATDGQQHLTPSTSLHVVAEDGSVSAVVVTGRTDGDATEVFAAMAAAIGATGDHAGPAQRSILAHLGLDTRNPRLPEIDGTTERDGVRYDLVYSLTDRTLTLTATLTA